MDYMYSSGSDSGRDSGFVTRSDSGSYSGSGKYASGWAMASVTGLMALLFLGSCGSTGNQTATTDAGQGGEELRADTADTVEVYRQNDERTAVTGEAGGDNGNARERAANEHVQLQFKNEQFSISINLDTDRAFRVQIPGIMTESQRLSGDEEDDEVSQEEVQNDRIQRVMRYFRRAQELFYDGQYEQAMRNVDASLEIEETAEALGLKGTLFLMLDNMASARRYWLRAVEKDPEIPVPGIPEIESFIEDILDES